VIFKIHIPVIFLQCRISEAGQQTEHGRMTSRIGLGPNIEGVARAGTKTSSANQAINVLTERYNKA